MGDPSSTFETKTKKKFHLLHVDDDQNFLELTKIFLEKNFSKNLTVNSLMHSPLVFTQLKKKNYDIIISDYQMPQMNGLELLTQLRSQNINIPFVIFTGKSREEIVIKALNLGANYYIEKSKDLKNRYNELFHAIKTIMSHKHLENAFQESEAKKQVILDVIPDLLFTLDRETKHIWYKGARTSLFVDPEEFLGKTVSDVLPTEVAQHYKYYIQETLKTNQMQIFEYQLPFKDGIRFYEARMVVSGKDEVLVMVRNISQKKRLEKDLRLNEIKYQTIFQNANDALFLIELTNEGFPKRFITVNDLACQRYGYTQKEFLLLSPYDITDSAEIPIIPKIIEELLIQGKKIFNLTHVTKEGFKFPVEISTHRFKLQGMNVALSIARDISDRQRALKQLQKQKEELSDFVHTINHDLLQYLATIDGNATLLETNYDKSLVENIHQQVENVSNFLFHSLTLAEAGLVVKKTNKVDLKVVVEMIAETTIPDNIAFFYDSLPTVIGDREKIYQIFQNLLTNAVMHGNPKKIEIRRRDSDTHTNILISNDGRPIPHEIRNKIFNRGFTTNEDKGKGIGLFLVKKLVNAHDWQIILDSSSFTTFCLSIPFNQQH